jgi:hypothetical protein
LDPGSPSVSFQSLKSVVHIIDYDNVIVNGRLFYLLRIAFSMKLATAPVNWNNADAPDFREWFPYPKILDLMVAAGYSATEWGMNMPRQVNPMLADLGERQLRLLGGFVGLELRNEAKFTTEIERAIELGRFFKLLGGQVLIAADSGDQRRLAQSGRWNLADAVKAFIFSPLGTGNLDLRRVLEQLRDQGYNDWLVVEQDTTPLDPTTVARQNRTFLEELLNELGIE